MEEMHAMVGGVMGSCMRGGSMVCHDASVGEYVEENKGELDDDSDDASVLLSVDVVVMLLAAVAAAVADADAAFAMAAATALVCCRRCVCCAA